MDPSIYQPSLKHGMKSRKDNWLGSVDIGFLTETERDMIIDVLRRDEKLRTYEKKRIIELKSELRDVRRKGAKKAEMTYSTHICERCNVSTGHIINKAYTCPICKHKTCENCRVNSKDLWICIVCYKEGKIKAKSGEWFYEAMRAELKPLADGSTLLKRAVLATSPSKKSVRNTRRIATPEIKYTPASSSSNSRRSSFNSSPDMTSLGSMESLSSSTESHSRSYPNRFGPAETGSIESLRSLRYLHREPFSDSDHSASSIYSSSYRSEQASSFSSPLSAVETNSSPCPKRLLDTYSLPRDPASPNQHSPKLKFPFDNVNESKSGTEESNDSQKSNSLKQKFHKAGKKLQSYRTLSRSVPMLAQQKPSPSPSLKETNSSQERERSMLPGSPSTSTSNSPDESKDQDGSSDAAGEIKFSLEYDYKLNNLLVFIDQCRGLHYVDIHRKNCDPYVKCYLLPDKSAKRKTTSKKHTTSPNFNQTLKFPVDISELGNRILEMSVWNAATFSRNSFLGHLQVGLDSWKWQPNPTPHWYPLKQKELLRPISSRSDIYKGDLDISVSYKSPDKCLSKHGELHVMIKQAKNLVPTLPNGSVDAFARLAILPEKDVQEKTNVITGNVNPMWNANFRLPFLHHPVEGNGLEITLWRKPRGSSHSKKSRRFFLGGIRLASGKYKDNDIMSTTEEERLIWEKICSSGGSWVDASLSLRMF